MRMLSTSPVHDVHNGKRERAEEKSMTLWLVPFALLPWKCSFECSSRKPEIRLRLLFICGKTHDL